MEEKQRKRRRRRKQQQEERTKRQEECVSERVISWKQITVKQQPEGEKKMSDATACCRRHGGDREETERGRRSSTCPHPRLHTQRGAEETLTGGLVAAFRDSISAWVIHTLLVDCSGARKVATCSHGSALTANALIKAHHLNKDGRLVCTSSRCAKVKISWTPDVTSSGTRVLRRCECECACVSVCVGPAINWPLVQG